VGRARSRTERSSVGGTDCWTRTADIPSHVSDYVLETVAEQREQFRTSIAGFWALLGQVNGCGDG